MPDPSTSAGAMAAPDHGDGYACARAWSALTAAHAILTERLGLALLDATGLSINDFEVLLRLEGVPSPGLRLGDLQDTVRLSQPALSRMAARLENRALLRRAGDPTDRRGVVLTITPAGQRTLRRAAAVHAEIVQAALLDQLTPAEHDQLAGPAAVCAKARRAHTVTAASPARPAERSGSPVPQPGSPPSFGAVRAWYLAVAGWRSDHPPLREVEWPTRTCSCTSGPTRARTMPGPTTTS